MLTKISIRILAAPHKRANDTDGENCFRTKSLKDFVSKCSFALCSFGENGANCVNLETLTGSLWTSWSQVLTGSALTQRK